MRELFAQYLQEHGTLLEPSQTPVATRSSFTSRESALERGVDSRLARQSGLHGQAVYWAEPISASPHSTVCHPSVGQPSTRAGSYAGRSVEPDRSRCSGGYSACATARNQNPPVRKQRRNVRHPWHSHAAGCGEASGRGVIKFGGGNGPRAGCVGPARYENLPVGQQCSRVRCARDRHVAGSRE